MDRRVVGGLCAALVVGLSGCTSIGNDLGGTCVAGQTCICDILGNCEKDCPGGGCHFACKNTGNCIFDCAGGGCDLTCQNTGNCILTCPGNDCHITCAGGQSNCILRDCQKSCPSDARVDVAPWMDRGRDLRRDTTKRDGGGGDGKRDGGKPDGNKNDGKPDSARDLVGKLDGCVPTTCAKLGMNCGTPGDGCGGTLGCGATCSVGTCGGGGTTGVCSCATNTTLGPTSPGVGTSSAVVGSVAWTNPGQILAADAGSGSPPSGVAWAFLYGSKATSNYLVASGFGLSIPSGALVNGIQVEIRRQASLGASNIADGDVRLLSGSTALTGNRAASGAWSTSWTYATYGGPTDLWGRLWTPAELNAANFGVALSAHWVGSSGNDMALVDHVRITVYYASSCCVPTTCQAKGLSCGSTDDGCGKTLDCGSCASGDSCVLGTCNCANGVKDPTESDVDCGGVCVQKCGGGKTCNGGGDCASALSCADGVCCDTACSSLCQACVSSKTGAATGTCANITAGTDPDNECAQDLVATCGKTGMCKNGACELYAASTPCVAATCVAGQATPAKTCDGTGQCLGGTPVACVAPYTCNLAGTDCQSCSDGTKNGYETDVDCGGSTSSCARCAQGKTCLATSDCAGGLSCVDGVCCNSPCGALCMACVSSKTGAASGTCANITAGTDPDNECPGQKNCSNGSCQ